MPYCDCRLPIPPSDPDRYDDPYVPPFTCCARSFQSGLGFARARYTILQNTLAVTAHRQHHRDRRFYRPLIRHLAGRLAIHGCKEGRLRLTRHQKTLRGKWVMSVFWKSREENMWELAWAVRRCLGSDSVEVPELEGCAEAVETVRRGGRWAGDLEDELGKMEV